MDAAGILDEIGAGAVTDLAVGDRVMAIVLPFGSHGAYSEFLVVPAESVAPAPAGSSHAEASTLPMNGLTARLSLDLLKLAPGQTIAVTGAAGAYGGYLVQLAKAAGLTVLADASEKDRTLVQSLGADVVLPRGDDLATHIRAHLPDGVDAVADGALLFEKVMPAIKDGGGLAVVRGFTGTAERGITVHPVWVREYVKAQAKLAELGCLVESGQVTLRVARTVPAAKAAEAHRILEAGGTRGRVVIEF